MKKFKKMEKKVAPKKTVTEKFVEPKKVSVDDVLAEVITPPKLFHTTDRKLAEKLQDKFTYSGISVDYSDPSNQIEHFTFNATEKEVADFLKGA